MIPMLKNKRKTYIGPRILYTVGSAMLPQMKGKWAPRLRTGPTGNPNPLDPKLTKLPVVISDMGIVAVSKFVDQRLVFLHDLVHSTKAMF